jgi:hypothetical protein
MTAYYPLVLDGSQIEELQAGDTINATVSNATNATNISGGAAGSVPYQTGATNTTFLALGASGSVITAGATAPQYTTQSSLAVGTATNLAGGTAGALSYNTGAGATTFLALGTSTHILTAGASAPQYTDPSTITVGTATNATNATNTGITDDTTTNASMYLTWVTANTGNLPQKVTSTKLTFNPSSGVLTCTGGVSGGTF